MKLLVLDRDGVINEDADEFIKTPDEWQPIPGSLEAIALLNRSGYRVVIATNQSGLARGLLDLQTLHEIHRKMHHQLEKVGGHIDGIFFCPHGPNDNCPCRKPKPGLLVQAGERFFLSPSDMLVVGDSLRDLEAAQSIGANAILVLTGKGGSTRELLGERTVPIYRNLSEVAKSLINKSLVF
ncbi:MAG: D-glycero-beta-D-manno-heptose 1,7-bisphosphate 7-phosphatase [Gammaproteobacteria bacterium]|nr:D-glycero-beta-D-manno-heptose 1,7-bisphosphate 7-phosphatase [Gammaproteobacteria bacterium]